MRKLSFLCVVMMTTALAACDRKPKSEAPAASGWQMSSNKVTWAPIVLPSTDWKCEHCDRYFKTTIRGVPKSVKFRFASDNQARMMVNGTQAFADFWKDGLCSDEPCCARCCDSIENCQRLVAEGPPHELSATALRAFREGDNEVMWEVHQDTGGSGFHVEMDVGR